jgi:hypothetical protein
MTIRQRIQSMLLTGRIGHGEVDRIEVVFPRALELEHQRNPRRFAQVDVDRLRFEFAPAILELDEDHQVGVIAHEVGHVLAHRYWEDLSEDGADRAAAQFLGITIRYDDRWPGKGLQCMAKSTSRKNPVLDVLQTLRRFGDLLLDESPDSFSVAQDLLLEQRMTLARASMAMGQGALDSPSKDWTSGMWDNDDGTFNGTFEVTRGPEVDGRWPEAEGIAWYVARTSTGQKWFVHVAVHVYDNHAHHAGGLSKLIVPTSGERYATREEGRDVAITWAWHAVKVMKEHRGANFLTLEKAIRELPCNRDALWRFPIPRDLYDADAPFDEDGFHRSGYHRNPAWVTHAIADSFESLIEQVQPQWMPKLDAVRGGPKATLVAKLTELGCGAYGCVLPTYDPGIVLKVTTDDTEAEFAGELAGDLVEPICVDYVASAELASKHAGRPVFLLWRESADDVGQVGKVAGADAAESVHLQHQAAQQLYLLVHQGNIVGRAFESAVTLWKTRCRDMGRFPELASLASGMLAVFDQQNIFFGDIHEGNLGRVWRGEPEARWVITDPGHVAVLPV